jgi:hypothetical protein
MQQTTYEVAIVRRGGAEGFGAYRYHRGDRVEPARYQVRKHPRLRGRAGTVTAVTRPDARSYRVTVDWELPGRVEKLEHPSSGLIPQRDDRGRPLRVEVS